MLFLQCGMLGGFQGFGFGFCGCHGVYVLELFSAQGRPHKVNQNGNLACAILGTGV